jgi:tRNA pseudouridine38-40 synthase
MRVRATVGYDGTDFSGFQRQANAWTVQEALETALGRVSGEMVAVIAAGRTDAGVHASGQVIAFDTRWRHAIGSLERALNAVLPSSVAVRGLEPVEGSFHPRYDAISRAYRYSIYNDAVRCPVETRYSLHVAHRLDVEGMQGAANYLVGEHDLATFGRSPREGGATVRRVMQAAWTANGPRLTFQIEANAFLYRMVRSIVGTLIEVGRGAMSVDDFVAAFASRDRAKSGPSVLPHGLFLFGVTY